MKTAKLRTIDILMDERYDDLKDLWRAENEDGARWYNIDEMVEYMGEDEVLSALDVSPDAVDAVILGEARNLKEAERLIYDEAGPHDLPEYILDDDME